MSPAGAALKGVLDLQTVPAVLAGLPEAIAGPLDLSMISRCDSAGVALLLECQRRSGGTLSLTGVPAQLGALMDFYRVRELFR